MGIYKRDQVWWMDFMCNGKRVRRSCETTSKKSAEKIYFKVKTQVAEGKWFEVEEASQRTFKELADKYEAQEFKQLKNWQSVQSYFNQLKEFFGHYPLAEITPALIDDFKQMRKAKGVQPSSINRQLTILRRMLNLAKKRWMWLKDVPSVEMEPKADKKRIRHLSFDEYHRVLDCCESWLRNIVAVATWTGLRQNNVLHLETTQVNLLAKTITLDGCDMKNHENLVIPVSAPALEVLKKAMKVTHLKSPYVFCKDDGTPYGSRTVQRRFKDALTEAGIEDFRFHDLRHCFATWNREAGVDLDTLADLMGHKDTRMTRRYAHITSRHLKSAVSLLEQSYEDSVTISSQSIKKGASQFG